MQERILFVDFETRSFCDLLARGTYNYAKDLTTEILCCGFEFSDSDKRWMMHDGAQLPYPILVHINSGGKLIARNAGFDRLIWEYVAVNDFGWPETSLEQWYCSMFVARCNNLPASLEDCCRALDTKHKKSFRGAELIRKMSIPPFEDTPELRQEMQDYCMDDVRSDKDAVAWMRWPTDEEWEDYWHNERINDRGIKIDREMARAATKFAIEEEAELVAIISELTEGDVIKARGEKLKAWVMARLSDDHKKMMAVYKTDRATKKTTKKYSLDKNIRARLLLEEIDPIVHEVLEASDMAQKSSVSKFKKMLTMADDDDDRVRGAILANGASASGRYSSRGLQFHNFPSRDLDLIEDYGELREDVVGGNDAAFLVGKYDLPIMKLLSLMLRSAIIPAEGKVLCPYDWAAIEGRVAPWLCNTSQGDAKLDMFRKGVDTYLLAASVIHGREIKKGDPERQEGKISELACQFGGGWRAIVGFARNYGMRLTEDDGERIKDGWRAANPWAKKMWYLIEGQAKKAVRNPGEVFKAGRLQYFCMEGVLNKPKTLFCELPCGRLLTYPDIVLKTKATKWGTSTEMSALRAAWKPKADETQWPRSKLYGGLMFENAVQAAAASALREVVRYDDTDMIMHVHDECVWEVPLYESEEICEYAKGVMTDSPDWTQGLPLAVAGKLMMRYGK